MDLLERDAALASLGEYAQQARAGQGCLVLVAGEAGVGKSTLVEVLAERLADARWAWGLCDGLFTPRPLGPLFDIAAELGGELLELSRSGGSREELFGALLRQLGAPGTLHVVVIEDLHWADEATIDLVRFLARRVRNVPVLLVVTYRDDSLAPGHPLRIALGDLGRQRSTRRIGLAPLSADAVAVLAGDHGLEPVALHRLTGGNPYFVSEVVRAGAATVPASARDAVLARVAELSGDARGVLDAAALIGTRIEPRLLAAATIASATVLDELVDSGLLVGDGPGLRFRHELGRLAVEQAVPAHRTGLIHARILAALQDLGSDDDAGLAHHAEAAGDTAAALHHAVRAARRAAGFKSHREAAAQYQRAVRCDPDDPRLYDALGVELSFVDGWAGVAEAADRARTLWRAAGDPLREGAALRLHSAAMVSLCRGREAIGDAEAAIAVLEPLGPGVELARAYGHLAKQRLLADRNAEAVELAGRSQDIAAPLGLVDVLSDTMNTEAVARRMLGQDWTGLIRRALDIAVANRLDGQAGRAYTNLYGMLCRERRYPEADPVYQEAIAYCDEFDVDTFGTCLRGERANSLARMGRWDDALALCREVLTRVEEASPINRIYVLYCVATVRARRDEDGVWAALDEAAASADGCGEPQWIVKSRIGRAEAFWLAGKVQDARVEAELADDVVGDADGWMRGWVAVWLRRTGSDRPARGELAEPFRLEIGGDCAGAAAAWLDLSCPYDAALALLGAADEQSLRRAVGMLGDLGATAAVRVARQLMRDRGIRSVPTGPQTATRADPHGLTRREQEVLHLICAGNTNAEIAANLVLSVKTVDHHVSAVLSKLGVSTRAKAIRKVQGSAARF
ncbi:helix-turn-helix transcriptional regulator [Dactylosporangium siamense]|uniref:LuxR family transcriptional regulator n=1 Tax=Dactylosporangium siamense TaxID=685454 RepID=A0A919UAZ1_9ACTN|nr:LuxR family transcriptional regulator [Dactylosporangium siamense]GIG48567.1 LuxR family transcriptional regulator [Dactylosporangium siamense]